MLISAAHANLLHWIHKNNDSLWSIFDSNRETLLLGDFKNPVFYQI